MVIAGGIFLSALALIAAASGLLRRRSTSDASLAALVNSANAKHRSIEPRLSGGFAWAPLRPSLRGNDVGTDVSFVRAIAQTLTAARDEQTPAALHASGIARLLAGKTREALADLRIAAEAENDPSFWADLGAAFYTTAVQRDAPELLADGLASCDRALSLDPKGLEPLFNRALVLQRLGLRDDAREAWERYLTADPSSAWAVEARNHLKRVEAVPAFVQVLDREYDRFARDPAAVLPLARRDPESARGYGWMEILGRWGEATVRNDPRDAERHLSIARNLGAAVQSINGEPMLVRVTTAIDAADPSTRESLARAHVDYRSGIKAFQDNRPRDAEHLLRRAAAAFEPAGSPMALNARYFAANTAHEQGRREEALQQLRTLLANAPQDFPVYRAQLQWQIGVCHAAAGDWGAGIASLEASAKGFEALGEHHNAAAVHRALAFSYDRLGDPERAWNERMASLRGGGVRSTLPLAKAVASIAQVAMMKKNWSAAQSFLSLHANIARRLADDVQLTDALVKRAGVRVRLNDVAGAREDLANATLAIARIEDPAYRHWGDAVRLRALAALATSPAEATQLLTAAIEFQSKSSSEQMNLPGLLLERGRARRKANDAAGAADDFRAGIEHLEKHRGSLPAGEARWGAFYAAEDLFEEAIDLAVAGGAIDRAFAIAEASRARVLLESYGHSPSFDARNLPEGVTIVEYAALPSRLVIFTLSRSGLKMISDAVERRGIADEIDRLSHALQSDTDWRAAARAVHQRLIAPIRSEIFGSATLVFVPDPTTSAVPFSSLVDGQGALLIEQHTVVISPSAAVFAASNARHGAQWPRSVLVISSADGNLERQRLAFVNAEAGRVGAYYESSAELREMTDFAALAKSAAEADVIHFAGHAVGDDSGLEPASLLLRQNDRQRRVRVPELASLKLRPTSTVVLAGCNTARGERRAAEGVVSVAHGFLTAGASSVIATLWPIDDQASAILFPRLHAHLAQGLPAAEALRTVQLEALRSGDIRPSFWAALQDIGR